MKLSELIKQLQAIEAQHGGDLPVVHYVEAAGMSGHFEACVPDVQPFVAHYSYRGEVPAGTTVVELMPAY